jgi:phosphate/sulfate permease
MHFLLSLLRTKGLYIFSSITLSFSGGASQTALGILCACYISWLHQEWSVTAILVQPSDITCTEYAKFRLCSTS